MTSPAREGAEAIEAIVVALSRYIGPNMARSSVRGQCEKQGVSVETAKAEQIVAIIDALCLALNVFIGRDKAKQVRAELIGAVRGGES